MRNIIVLIICILIGTNVYSQFVYFGYPDTKEPLNKGDRVIVNFPKYLSCKYLSLDDFDNLAELIKINENNKLRIEVNYCMGDTVRTSDCLERLFSDLKEALELKTTLDNYTVVNNGCRNPVFLSKDEGEMIFSLYNTRIEIIVE